MPSITRAFTTRRVKMSLELAQEAKERAAVQRSNTINAAPPTRSKLDADNAYRPKISGPVELIHTTNMLSYNAPDLPRPSTSSSSQVSTKSAKSSSNTDNDSDSSPGTAASSPPTSPDVSPSEMKRSLSPEPNHLSCYFMSPQQIQDPRPAPSIPAPTIPQRAPSHTKQASMDAMTRQRSTGRLQKANPRAGSMSRSNGAARSPAHSVSPSTTSHRSFQSQSSVSSAPPPTPVSAAMPHAKIQLATQHPFSQELAQVTEMAEEFGVNEKMNGIDEEERELISRGLCKFSADVYLHDIQTLTSMFFNDRDARQSRPAPALWI